MGGHLAAKFQADCFYLGGSKPDGCAGHIHGYVAAADNQNVPADCLPLSHIGFMQEGQGHKHAGVSGSWQGQAFTVGKAGAYNQGVELVSELSNCYVFPNLNPGTGFYSGGQYLICISFEHLPGQAVYRQRGQEVPAQSVVSFVNYHTVAQPGQIISGGKPAGASSHHGHFFACFAARRGALPGQRAGCFHSEPFEIANG
jgi:hypothetical protein